MTDPAPEAITTAVSFLAVALAAWKCGTDARNIFRAALVLYAHQWREDPAAARRNAEEWLRIRFALRAILGAFVARWDYRPRQRTEAWYLLKQGEAGGSELKIFKGGTTLLARLAFVSQKAGITKWFCANPSNLDWGTVLEAALERLVEIDLGIELMGADLSVPAPYALGLRDYHSNSPDGYGIPTFFYEDGAWRLLTTDAETLERAARCPQKQEVDLFEFKNAITRVPRNRVPSYYVTQLYSGIACAAPVTRAIFVDGSHRRCAFGALGPEPGYDHTFHVENKGVSWDDAEPVAWGFTAVYAPLARARAVGGAVDPAWEADLLRAEHFGTPFARGVRGAEPVDFGACAPDHFRRMLRMCATDAFPTRITGPCFRDGRGAPGLLTAAGRDRALGDAQAAAATDPALAGHRLLGVFPWKLLRVDYVVQTRDDDFLPSIRGEIIELCDAARAIRAAPDPAAAFCAYEQKERAAAAAAAEAQRAAAARRAKGRGGGRAGWQEPDAAPVPRTSVLFSKYRRVTAARASAARVTASASRGRAGT